MCAPAPHRQLSIEERVLRASGDALNRSLQALVEGTQPRPDGSYPATATVLLKCGLDHMSQLTQRQEAVRQRLHTASLPLTQPSVHHRYTHNPTFPSAGVLLCVVCVPLLRCVSTE